MLLSSVQKVLAEYSDQLIDKKANLNKVQAISDKIQKKIDLICR